MFDNRSLLKPIERAIDRPVLRVSVSQHHGQALVPGKLLDSLYIGTRCGQSGYGGVPHYVRHYHNRVHARSLHAAAERSVHTLDVPAFRPQAREYPTFRVFRHLLFPDQDLGNAPGQRLPSPSSALDVNAQSSAFWIKIVESSPEDLGMSQ